MDKAESSEDFLQAVLESFVDGILVLTEHQELMYANEIANSICSQLVRETEPLPKELQQVCEALVESKEMHGNQPVTIESNIGTEETTFRVRAQWLKVEASQHPCILLRLQNQDQAVHGLAIAEAQKWNLTPRETEVWSLRRAGFKRKEIAAELYIAEDTVKKHLKNIQFKRQAALDEEEWRSNQAS